MTEIERDILILISRIRCITETQFGKIFGTRKRYGRKLFKKTLRKMCNEYILKKYPCDINYSRFKENSYVYYLNGSQEYQDKELAKAIIESEIAIKIDLLGYKLNRFYRNIKIDNNKYDLFIEYTNQYDESIQMIVDIYLDDEIDISKYKDIKYKFEKSTIPFYKEPKILIVSLSNIEKLFTEEIDSNIKFTDLKLNNLFKYL